MCSGELCSDLMLRLREGRCGGVEVQDWEGKEHPPLDILGMEQRKCELKAFFLDLLIQNPSITVIICHLANI